jgi:hypothetical protein
VVVFALGLVVGLGLVVVFALGLVVGLVTGFGLVALGILKSHWKRQ